MLLHAKLFWCCAFTFATRDIHLWRSIKWNVSLLNLIVFVIALHSATKLSQWKSVCTAYTQWESKFDSRPITTRNEFSLSPRLIFIFLPTKFILQLRSNEPKRHAEGLFFFTYISGPKCPQALFLLHFAYFLAQNARKSFLWFSPFFCRSVHTGEQFRPDYWKTPSGGVKELSQSTIP